MGEKKVPACDALDGEAGAAEGGHMTVIEFAERRLQDEIKENDHGAENGHLLAYWAAYLDGARAQKEEDSEQR